MYQQMRTPFGGRKFSLNEETGELENVFQGDLEKLKDGCNKFITYSDTGIRTHFNF